MKYQLVCYECGAMFWATLYENCPECGSGAVAPP